ncbi:hypothetical protein QTG56_24160 (plasmid) [Rossellomorea sp. AcN35-11]|nr:hypothetical protein [Rossellomorea aquimaris]WJV31734.1 hypothetical protein QTG56_24160 [Rossellomorea sp. AcN35-11]
MNLKKQKNETEIMISKMKKHHKNLLTTLESLNAKDDSTDVRRNLNAMINFQKSFLKKVKSKIENKKDLSEVELKVLKRATDSENSFINFYLMDEFNSLTEEKRELVQKALTENGYNLIDNVAYVHFDRTESYFTL